MGVDVPRLGTSSIIQKGIVFEDMSALKLWLQEYVVVHNRLFQVKNSYAKQRYTIKCEVAGCAWKVCACKLKVSERFRITSVSGAHTCGSSEPNQKHWQLTSKFIST